MVSNKFKLRNQKGFAHLVLVLVVGVVVVVGLVLASGDGGKLGVFAGKGGNRGKPPKQSPEPKQSVTVQTPNGGESYEVGDTLKMRWTVTEYSQYSQETSYVLLATRVTEPDGSYSYNDQIQIASNVNMKNRKNSLDWVIPETVPNGDRYVIIVGINASNLDYSDGVFTIINSAVSTPEPTPTPLPTTNPTPTPGPVSSLCDNSTGTVEVKVPNGGESYEVGDTVLLKWCVNNYSEYSQQYSKIWLAARSTQIDGTFVHQNQVLVADDVAMIAGENSLNWVVPAEYVVPDSDPEQRFVVGGSSYVLAVSINSFFPNYDYSDNVFAITNPANPTPPPNPTALCDSSTGRVEVMDPNGGETYNVGNTMIIKWCVNDINEYNQNNSSIWLATRSTQSSGSFVYRNQVEIANDLLMTAGENTLNWGIPNTVLNGGAYVILVSINNFNPNFDYSDGSFTINNP